MVPNSSFPIAAGASRNEIMSRTELKGFADHESPGARLSLGANLGVAYDELRAQ